MKLDIRLNKCEYSPACGSVWSRNCTFTNSFLFFSMSLCLVLFVILLISAVISLGNNAVLSLIRSKARNEVFLVQEEMRLLS